MASNDDIYAAAIFFNAVLPLLKEIVAATPVSKKFAGKNGILQVSAKNGSELWATHFVLEDGALNVVLGAAEKPDVELAFKSLETFNAFFKGTSKKLPAIRGIRKLGLLIPMFKALLTMSALLSATEAPKDEARKALVAKLYFYLLSSGISQLNKAEHPAVKAWSSMSPDRVYAWSIDGHPDIAAYMRVKAGNTKAARGMYTRSKPFFTMRFADIDSALGILLQTADLLDMTAKKKLIMEGAPEFGAQIGEFMELVGSFAKA